MDSIYFHIVAKLIMGFILIVAYIQLSGKGSLAPISALDQVGNIVLGSIIGGTLYNSSVGIITMIAVSGIWAGLLLFVRYLSFKRNEVKTVVDGHSIQLMDSGELLSENFISAKISVRDFIMLLHQRGYNTLQDISDVWFEYNGQMTVVKKGEKPMASVVIENGVIDQINMERSGLTEAQISKEVERQGYAMEDIFLAEWYENALKLFLNPEKKEEEQK